MRALLSAFEPYDRWSENSSWEALTELTHWYDGDVEITTRRYPVRWESMAQALHKDLCSGFDIAIHLGQAPGAPVIKLEAVGLNLRTDGQPLVKGGPEAYRSPLPLDRYRDILLSSGIPTVVSHHAGLYLCNATLFLSQHQAHQMALPTRSLFVHLPLTPAEASKHRESAMPSMSSTMSAAAIALILEAASVGRLDPVAPT
ncbi:MAG: pyroglutamyl-peptidase I [Planctomycetota bacterium]